jgi:putative acetyltransferase
MTLTTRRASPREAGATALLVASHAYLQSLYPPEDNFFLSIDDLCTPAIAFFVAERDGQTFGCAALATKEGYGEVKSMFTDPAVRGAGTGAVLMAALEAEARAQGLPRMVLETGDDLFPAHRLYARHGFALCGPFGDYIEGAHSVFMEKWLT